MENDMSNERFFFVRLAGLTVKITHTYDSVREHCRDYTVDATDTPDIAAATSQDLIEAEKNAADYPFSDGYCEDICLYRDIAEKMPLFDRAVFHGAAVEVDGKGYIFTAPSGTGKTTHIRLWLAHFADKVQIINGDKPILRLDCNKVSVCSTPWAGKERLERNTEAPLGAITLIKRSTENKITKISPKEYFSELARQFYLPKNVQARLKTLDIIDKILSNVPIYLLECDISREAAKLSFDTLTKE